MKKLTAWGFVLTGVWILFIASLIYHYRSSTSLTLNEIGDFLAGAISPLAFFWLVIGYFQHGEEIRRNTKAVDSQQKELGRQVKETALLVKHSERQAQAAETLAEVETSSKERAILQEETEALPDFHFCGGGVQSTPGGGYNIVTEILNRGAVAGGVELSHDNRFIITLVVGDIWEYQKTGNIIFPQIKNDPALEYPIIFSLEFNDRLRNSHVWKYEFYKAHEFKRIDTE